MNTAISRIYIFLISLALLFHVFNNLQINESLKVFHIFACSAMCVGFTMQRYQDQFTKSVAFFLIWTVFSSAISPVEPFSMSLYKLLIIILSLSAIQGINIDRLIVSINCIIPIALFFLLRQYNSESPFRFEGFYEDPNYFCTTLLVFYFYIMLLWERSENIWLRVFFVAEIVLILLLTSLSLSRTGLLCMALMTLVSIGRMFKKHPTITVLGIIVIIIIVFGQFDNYIDTTVSGLMERQTGSDSDTIEGAANLRLEISMRGINYLLSHPLYFLQGIGFGTYSNAGVLSDWPESQKYIDHNSLTSCFSEQGFIGLLLLLRSLYLLFIKIKNSLVLKQKGLKYYYICTLVILLIFSVSINQMTYLPFWLAIFTLSNLSNETAINK